MTRKSRLDLIEGEQKENRKLFEEIKYELKKVKVEAIELFTKLLNASGDKLDKHKELKKHITEFVKKHKEEVS